MSRWSMLALPLSVVILANCDGGGATEPHENVPRRVVAGNYALNAAGETTSSAWPGYAIRFEGILALRQDVNDPAKLKGTFSDLRDTDGLPAQEGMHGVIEGSVDANGALILHLKALSRQFTWTGRGIIVDSRISGQWQSSDLAAGGFTAHLVE